MYRVKEIFYTLQGEGTRAGRPAVFLRFTGCNLWSGREKDRASAICRFCDTDFVGDDGGRFHTADALADAVLSHWPRMRGNHYVVCTGGEPMLQLDEDAVEALHARRFKVAIETNGTMAVTPGVDWVCVSPKAGTHLVQTRGHELKLVYPQPDCEPADYLELAFGRFLLQPMDGPDLEENTRLAVEYCLDNPHWSLSLQTHKMIGIR